MSCNLHFGHSRLPDDESCPFCERDRYRAALEDAKRDMDEGNFTYAHETINETLKVNL